MRYVKWFPNLCQNRRLISYETSRTKSRTSQAKSTTKWRSMKTSLSNCRLRWSWVSKYHRTMLLMMHQRRRPWQQWYSKISLMIQSTICPLWRILARQIACTFRICFWLWSCSADIRNVAPSSYNYYCLGASLNFSIKFQTVLQSLKVTTSIYICIYLRYDLYYTTMAPIQYKEQNQQEQMNTTRKNIQQQNHPPFVNSWLHINNCQIFYPTAQ